MRSVSPLFWKWNAGNETSWNEDITNLWHLFITHTWIEMSQVELRTTVSNCCSNHLVSFFPQTIHFPLANAVVEANLLSDAACTAVFVCSFVLWHSWWVWVSFTQLKVNLFYVFNLGHNALCLKIVFSVPFRNQSQWDIEGCICVTSKSRVLLSSWVFSKGFHFTSITNSDGIWSWCWWCNSWQ